VKSLGKKAMVLVQQALRRDSFYSARDFAGQGIRATQIALLHRKFAVVRVPSQVAHGGD
jgi:hypothetical protein